MTRKKTLHIEKEIPAHWFRSFLYKDPLFIEAYERLVKKLSNVRKDVVLLSESDDPKLQDLVIKPNELKFVDVVAKRFIIGREDIYCYDLYKSTGLLTGRLPVYYRDKEQIVIRIYPENKLQDIINVWPDIEDIQKAYPEYRQRIRTPDNPALIYAIYRQLRQGQDLKTIYKLYEKCELPEYTGSYGMTEEEMKRYYKRYEYKPDAVT